MRRFLGLILLGSIALFAQAPTPQTAAASDMVIGSGNFSPIVADLEKSLKFYNELVGATAPPTPPAFSNSDAALLNFLGVPTAQLRFSTVRIPGSTMGIEIVEFKDIDRKPVRARLQDPGATMLLLAVRDVDSMLARAKAAGASVVTRGGSPVVLPGSGKDRGVIVQDPDGFFIAFIQQDPLPETTAPAAQNIVGARVGLTVADMDQTMRLYKGVMGFEPQINAFRNDKNLLDLFNTPGAQLRRASAKIPGSAVQMEFLEFKDIDRKPINARIQDPRATRLQIRVRNTDEAVKALTAAGGVVTTTGGNGGPIDMRNLRVALVRELNNLFLVIMSQPPTR